MYPRPLNSNTGNTQDYRGLLVARLTAVYTPSSGNLAGRRVYEWTEQSISATGGDEGQAQARRGVYTSATAWDNVLLDANDADLAIGTYVWCRMKGSVGGATVYETVTPQLNVSGSGSGTDTDGDGTADRRQVGYNYDVACVGGVLQKSRQPIYQFLGSGLTSYGAWEAAGTVGCCECDDDPSDGGPTQGTFPACADAPAAFDWTCSSGDIACLDGQSGTINQSGSTWANGNNLAPGCSTDNGFTVTCTADVWTAQVDNAAGATTFLISQTATSLTFAMISDGTGTLAAGSATFVVVIP